MEVMQGGGFNEVNICIRNRYIYMHVLILCIYIYILFGIRRLTFACRAFVSLSVTSPRCKISEGLCKLFRRAFHCIHG